MAKQSLLFSCFFFFFLLLLIFATAALEEDGGGSNSDNIKCGPWSMDEDAKLLAYGANNWHLVVKNSGLNRIRQSCRRRYLNILRPGLKKERITREEANEIMRLQKDYGNKWAKIAKHLPGRTNEDIGDFWFRRKNTSNDHRLNAHSFTNRSTPQMQQNLIGLQRQHALATYCSSFWPSGSGLPFYFNEKRVRDGMLANPHDPNWQQSFGISEGRHMDSGFPPGTEVNGEAQNSRPIQTKAYTAYQN